VESGAAGWLQSELYLLNVLGKTKAEEAKTEMYCRQYMYFVRTYMINGAYVYAFVLVLWRHVTVADDVV